MVLSLDLPQVDLMNFRVEMLGREGAVVQVAKRPSKQEVLNKQDEGLFRKSTPSFASIENLKASVKAIYSAKLTRTLKAVTY